LTLAAKIKKASSKR